MMNIIWGTEDLRVDFLINERKEEFFILHNPNDFDEYICIEKEELMAFAKALLKSEE